MPCERHTLFFCVIHTDIDVLVESQVVLFLQQVPSVPVVTPYPYGSIPAYHHPSVPLFPTDQLLFPSVHAAVKTLLPPVLPKLLGSLPFLQPGAYDIDTLMHDPQLLQDVFPLSAEAPAPGVDPIHHALSYSPAKPELV
jgi:hypothetical protein